MPLASSKRRPRRLASAPVFAQCRISSMLYWAFFQHVCLVGGGGRQSAAFGDSPANIDVEARFGRRLLLLCIISRLGFRVKPSFNPSLSRSSVLRDTLVGSEFLIEIVRVYTTFSSGICLSEPMDVVHHHPVFVKDTSKYWYKPHISREEGK